VIPVRRSLLRILLIVVAAGGAGAIRAWNLPWIPDIAALEARKQRHQELRTRLAVSLEEMLALVEQGAVVIDARPRAEFEAGHLALDTEPPVLNVPPEEIESQLTRLMELQGLPVVLYCASEACEFAEELYTSLEAFGFTDIRIYFPGWEGIVKAGLPTTTGPDTWPGFAAAAPEVSAESDSAAAAEIPPQEQPSAAGEDEASGEPNSAPSGEDPAEERP